MACLTRLCAEGAWKRFVNSIGGSIFLRVSTIKSRVRVSESHRRHAGFSARSLARPPTTCRRVQSTKPPCSPASWFTERSDSELFLFGFAVAHCLVGVEVLPNILPSPVGQRIDLQSPKPGLDPSKTQTQHMHIKEVKRM